MLTAAHMDPGFHPLSAWQEVDRILRTGIGQGAELYCILQAGCCGGGGRLGRLLSHQYREAPLLDMAVSANPGVLLNKSSTILGSVLGPLIFGRSHPFAQNTVCLMK